MTYAVQQDMINNFGQQKLIELTDRSNTGAIDANVLGQALAAADAEINSYLVGQYALPLASVPLVMVNFACDVARYRLYDQVAPDQVKARYQDAIKFFTLVSAGKISLGLNPLNQPVLDAGNIVAQANDRVFSGGVNGTLSDY